MNILEKMDDFLNKVLLVGGGIALLFLMSLATGNVVLRVLGAPYRGAYELVAFSGAIVIAFSLGYTQKKKSHIVVDIITQRFSKSTNRILDGINYFITTILFSIVCWQVSVWGMKIVRSGEVSETLKIIFYPFVFSVSVGFGVLSLTLLLDFLNNLIGREDGK